MLSPTAILGYGFPEESFRRGIEAKPDVIAVDAGSTDPGPYYLGAGKSFTAREAVKRDLGLMLNASVSMGVPLIIGSAGGGGAKPHVDWTTQIVEETAVEQRLAFRMGVIYADLSPVEVLEHWENGRVSPLRSVPPLDRTAILGSARIVAQFGTEPIQEALSLECQVIVCGRCYDPAPFAAAAIVEGHDPGPALHMGKILECGAIAATPGSGRDCVLGRLSQNGFVLEALDPTRRFTAMSTAAHTLYEKSDPYFLPGPGGMLDLRDVRFEELGDGRVRVSGSRFDREVRPTVKIEGVRRIGFRTICVAGVRDPIMIARIEELVDRVKDDVLPDPHDPSMGSLQFRLYGRNGVMGALELMASAAPHELGIVIDAVAETQEKADALCGIARSTLLHLGYSGRISTAGNLAFPHSPSDVSCGEVYEFSIYHLLEVEDPAGMFRVRVAEVSP